MIQETNEKTKSNYSYNLVKGDSIEEIINHMIPKIRPKSQEGYKLYIQEDLIKKGHSLVDVHAGYGTMYELRLNNFILPKLENHGNTSKNN